VEKNYHCVSIGLLRLTPVPGLACVFSFAVLRSINYAQCINLNSCSVGKNTEPRMHSFLLLLRYLNGMNVILFISCKLDGIYHINHLKCYLPPAHSEMHASLINLISQCIDQEHIYSFSVIINKLVLFS
jgi:hypothetical protein